MENPTPDRHWQLCLKAQRLAAPVRHEFRKARYGYQQISLALHLRSFASQTIDGRRSPGS